MTTERDAYRSKPGWRSQRLLFRMGLVLLVVGSLCNEWLLAAMFSPDGSIDDPADLALIWLFQVFVLCWGILNVMFRRSPLVTKINLTLVALCVFSPLLGEVIFRLGIAGIDRFREPGLYADALSDDDFWKLEHLWPRKVSGDPNRPSTDKERDETLGWVPARTLDNPLGIVAQGSYIVDSSKNSVCFFGDSFVEGATSYREKIPQLLDRLLPDQTVYNFGVSGYGVDQIYLRMKSSHQTWQEPFLLMGILTSDLDRSVLRFRGAPKPYFVVRNNSLVLEGIPLTLNTDEWVQQNPPTIRSYLLAFLRMRYRLHQPGLWREHGYKRQQKIVVTRHILLEMTRYCRREKLPLCFVLFYEPDEFDGRGWREEFLLDELRQLHVDYVDTKPVLIAAASQSMVVKDFYRADHHLNGRGNRIVAEFIAEHLANRLASK